ncbi:MAG: SDR family oxidoreductase [Oscillospiraceae bacterium]|nr:SDR family oxidoreductase [Oscillospiraceae bacterium]
MRLEGKIVVVTAATRGIGYAVVEACAKEGATVYMGARNPERARERITALREKGYNVKYVYNDATDDNSYKTMIDSVVENEGRIDVLVNNFGTSNPRKDLGIANTQADEFIRTVTVNLKSVFLSSQVAINHMRRTGGGSIINISSIGGQVPDLSQIGYGTSKGAINYMTKLIAVQEARNNIRCNAVMPGMTATDAVMNNLTDEFQAFFLKHTPIKRMAMPEEIAAAVVYFASDDASFVTGQVMAVAVAGGFGLATPTFGNLNERPDAKGK